MSNRSEYHKQYRLRNKEKLNDYHKKYYHIKKNNDIDDNTNDKKINEEINKIPNLNFGDRMKLIREKKRDEFIKKMQDEGKLLDDSEISENSEDEKNEKIEPVEPSEHVEPVEHVEPDKDISITIKALMEELQETREENDNLKSMLENTNFLVEILNDQLISFHKQINEMEIKNKMNDLNNAGDQEEQNNYMDDGILDDNEENQIEKQLIKIIH